MPRRMMKPALLGKSTRREILDWLEWEIRKDRILHDGEPTLRGVRLQGIANRVKDGKDVNITGEDLPVQIAPNRVADYLLTGDQLIEN